MRKEIVIALAALVAACSTPTVSGNSQGGIMGSYGPEKTFKAAQAHCQKYGKDAKITQVVPDAEGSATFSCV